MNEINKERIEAMIRDQQARTAVTTDSHLWFFSVYFNHYMTYRLRISITRCST